MANRLRQAAAMLGRIGVATLLLSPPALAEEPLLSYGIDVVSDYVARGEDLYVRRFAKNREAHAAVNIAPAAQPSVTFFGPSGLSLNLWGSFALTDRADDAKKPFVGLGRDDELDYTLAFDWSNRLGQFTAALLYYSYFDACYGSQKDCTSSYLKANPADPVQPEAMVKWGMPFAKAVHPYLSYYANPSPGDSYLALGLSGGESAVWAASLGAVSAGIKDLTGKLGYASGALTIAANIAYRPNPELAGPYGKDGTYTVKGKTEHYPPAIVWLGIAWGGSVTGP